MVKIRLARRGRKKLAMYDVVVADARAPRDGRFIEKLGTYNPLTVPAKVEINNDRAFHWLMQGAQPSDTVKAMLSYRGVMLKKHLQIGVIKGALTQEQADSKLEEWVKSKEAKVQATSDKYTQDKQAQAKARKEAETKIREARAEAIRQKAKAAEEAAAPQAAEVPAEEAATEEAPAAETPAAETPAAEAPAAEASGEAKAE
ncbi:MAG TPA: 30S ribosomal protein S16 [Chryseosolibacter sp.]|nr:30S ribosomal protein S16 [Chryseosolibacter sp.]